MRVIVDTSVWSLALRRTIPPEHPALDTLKALLGEASIHLLGVIFQELLQGIKSKPQFESIKKFLNPFPLLTPSRSDHLFCAELYNRCRAKGLETSTMDCLIAGMAIQNDCLLLTIDSDFSRIAKVSDLKLL